MIVEFVVSGEDTVKKNDVEVVINGKQYTLCGEESSEYLQKIASHINEKYAEFKEHDSYGRLDADMKNILLAINLSDDYYKSQETVQELRSEKADIEKEIFDMKHKMISLQAELEDAQKKIQNMKDEKKEKEREIIRLQTELSKKK